MKLKFITLNIYEGGLLFDSIISFLTQENADVFVVQEVNNGSESTLPQHLRSLEVLQKAFPDYFSFFSPEMLMRYPEGKIEIGNAIFSKYPISNERTVFLNTPYGEYDPVPVGGDFSKHPKNMQLCTITIEGKEVHIANLHGIWELSGADTPERLEMSKRIIETIQDLPQTILAGDFNLKPDTQTIYSLEQHLVNIFKGKAETTFNLGRKDLKRFPGYAHAPVDMVFTSPDITTISATIPQVDISDHLPLVCTFSFANS